MSPDRRKTLQIISVGIAGSLGGCINVGAGDEEPDTNDGSTDSTDQSNQNSTTNGDTNETSNNDEQEEDDTSSLNTQFVSQINAVVDFLEYRKNGSGWRVNYNSYRDGLSQSIDTCTTLMEKNASEVTTGDIDTLESHLNKVKSTAYNGFGEYYRYHYVWSEFISNNIADLRDNVRRNETSLLTDRLQSVKSTLESVRGNMSDRYPDTVVDTIEPYERFLNTTGDRENLNTGFVFEGVHLSGNIDPFFVVGNPNVGFRHLPFGAGDIDRFDVVKNPFPDDRESSLRDNIEWFQRPGTAEDRHLLSVYDYTILEEDFPDNSRFNVNTTNLEGADKIDLNRADPIGISIQLFESPESATQAFDSIKSQGQPDGTTNHFDVEYENVFYIGDEQTYYISLKQVENMVIGLSPSTEPWDIRSYSYGLDNDDEEEIEELSLTDIADGLFIDATESSDE